MFFMFQSILSFILLGIQFYFFRKIRLKPKKVLRKPVRLCLDIIFTLFSLPLILMLFFHSPLYLLPQWLVYGGIYPLYIWHFSFFILFLFVVTGKIIKVPFLFPQWILKKFQKTKIILERIVQHPGYVEFDARRRSFIRYSGMFIAGATFTASTYGAFRRSQYELTSIQIPIQNLPEEFSGTTISLISDIHSSIFMAKEEMKRYADVVNELQSDVIAVTGDFVNSMVEEVYPFAEAFSSLRAPYGVFGVLGNHDYYTRQVETVAKEVNNCGIKLLRNTNVAIQKGNQKLYILGVDDVGSAGSASQLFDVARTGIEVNTPTVLFCHRPYFFRQAARRNIDLTLSGHTHGGQIVFIKTSAGVIAPARMVSPYVAGLYTMGASQMYVSRGIGTVGIPIRINCPPEVTKITLVKA